MCKIIYIDLYIAALKEIIKVLLKDNDKLLSTDEDRLLEMLLNNYSINYQLTELIQKDKTLCSIFSK